MQYWLSDLKFAIKKYFSAKTFVKKLNLTWNSITLPKLIENFKKFKPSLSNMTSLNLLDAEDLQRITTPCFSNSSIIFTRKKCASWLPTLSEIGIPGSRILKNNQT